MVRFPESKIKEAILHPDLEIRARAVRYFALANTDDKSIVGRAIEAVETYGREGAYQLIGPSVKLPHTEESIAWVIDELNDEQSGQYENYVYNLVRVLLHADPALLLPQEAEIRNAFHFPPKLQEPFSQRLQMLSWDATTCWQRLETFCDEEKDKRYANEIDVEHANRLIEALARHGPQYEQQVHSILMQHPEDARGDRMYWMEPLVVRLAGAARLNSTVPLLIAKLLEDRGDVINDGCATALSRIGTPDVVEAVAEVFPGSPRHFRLYGSDALEYIHSDLAVQKCLELFRQEESHDIQIVLAYVLLSQFALESIELTRRLLLDHELDADSRGLRSDLLETCELMGERFPEFDEWRAEDNAEKDAHWKRIKELEGDPSGLLLYALERLAGKSPAEAGAARRPAAVPPAQARSKPARSEAVRSGPLPPAPVPPDRSAALSTAGGPKVGRNETCPCGSGKKFKKCCMNSAR